MATFKNNKDGFVITKEPAFITEWEAKPIQEIGFDLPVGVEIKIGDRIHARVDLGTRGNNAGSPVDVFYTIQGGITMKDSKGTAMATRTEI